MEYPFKRAIGSNDPQPYILDEKRRGEIARFLSIHCEPGRIFTNADGERREVLDYRLPQGTISRHTAWRPRPNFAVKEPTVDEYHTPRAVIPNNLKEPAPECEIMYCEVHGDAVTKALWCTESEWMKWMGDSCEVEDKPPARNTPAQQKMVQAELNKKTTTRPAKKTRSRKFSESDD